MRYGEAARWQKTKEKHGTTHLARRRLRAKSEVKKQCKTVKEGRAPDTYAVIEARKIRRMKSKLLQITAKVKKGKSNVPSDQKSVPIAIPPSSNIPNTLLSSSKPDTLSAQATLKESTILPASEKVLSNKNPSFTLPTPSPVLTIQEEKCIQGFIWKENSCWLDSSLEALYQAHHPFISFPPMIFDTPEAKSSVLVTILQLFRDRKDLECDNSVTVADLTTKITNGKRNLRKMLAKKKIIQDIRHPDDYLVSLLLPFVV